MFLAVQAISLERVSKMPSDDILPIGINSLRPMKMFMKHALICDNYSTHEHQRVQRWLEAHKRFHVRFTPTSASWLNMVERFFRDLTQNRLRRGVFQDLEQLIMAIGEYIDGHNQNPKPFIWTAKANDILEKVTRAQTALNKRRSA